MEALERIPKHSEVLIHSRNTLKLRLIVILITSLSSHHIRVGTVGLDRELAVRVHCRVHDRRNLESILEDAADVRTWSMSVLHVTSKAEGKEGRLCEVQVDVASNIVLCELELRVKCCIRVSCDDT